MTPRFTASIRSRHVAVAGIVVAEGVGDADDRPVERVVGIAAGLDEGLAQEQREARIAVGGEALTQSGGVWRTSRGVISALGTRRLREAMSISLPGFRTFCQVGLSPSRPAAQRAWAAGSRPATMVRASSSPITAPNLKPWPEQGDITQPLAPCFSTTKRSSSVTV
mgnify:CR=1 FL=1